MQNRYSSSVNIIRDQEHSQNYITTKNASNVVLQISNDFKIGLRSFIIIGTYGTGKSSLLLALQKTLTRKANYFQFNLVENSKIDIINIMGEYRSLRASIADRLGIRIKDNTDSNIFDSLYDRYKNISKRNPLLVIFIDEFGKFLEFAAKNDPENELYFIQKLTEFINNPDNNIILISTVHQNFDAYSTQLTVSQRQEWTKVKGRFREIAFNEPVEQLLFLATQHIKRKSNRINEIPFENKIITLYQNSKAFNAIADFNESIVTSLYPLDIFSANIMTSAMQRYGQNERSLFSFLYSPEFDNWNVIKQNSARFFNISYLYNYLIKEFYSFIASRDNPDYLAWQSIKIALEQAERFFDKSLNEYFSIIKTIGLLNIFAAAGSNLGKKFLCEYSDYCLGIKNPGFFIEELERRKILLYRNYSNRFVLFEGTDLDIHLALNEAGNKVSAITDVASLLKKYYDLPPILAKEITYKRGTPRIFEYKISHNAIHESPKDEIDGYINLIFNEKIELKDIIDASEEEKEAILYCYYLKSSQIKELLFEIEKTQKVIEENFDDRVAKKELENILLHQKKLLNHKILNNFSQNDVVWIYKGKKLDINSKRQFNQVLSEICLNVYSSTPVFSNELVNRNKLSATINLAKKNLFKALVEKSDLTDLGFPEDKYPPEKTIYLSLLVHNGISSLINDSSKNIKTNNGFNVILNVSNDFLKSAKYSRKRISELFNILSQQPFKLKRGFLEFWIPVFLFISREDFALFMNGAFIPKITPDILETISKYPDDYELKTFNIAGIKQGIFNSFRLFLNQSTDVKLSSSNFIETIKPFFTFYRNLPEYSKNTKRLSKETLAVRNILINAKDPEKTFFEDFPEALNFSLETLHESTECISIFTTKLQYSIRELRTCYDNFLNRFEEFILAECFGEQLEFEIYKRRLQTRYKKLKRHLLLKDQKIFIQRIDNRIEDRNAWLESLGFALIGKPLSEIKDDEEEAIYDKFREMVFDLDSLTEISKDDFSEEKEKIVKLEVNSFNYGRISKTVRVPLAKTEEIKKLEIEIRNKLSFDKKANISALINILNEYLNHD